jgi:hypothetical protein
MPPGRQVWGFLLGVLSQHCLQPFSCSASQPGRQPGRQGLGAA